jgi:electron transport complex protein RnfD
MWAFLVRIFGALPFGGDMGNGDMLFSFLSGGTLAAAFLLASDPVTSPKSPPGLLFVTALAAIFGFIFRYWGLEQYGVFFAITLLNALVPLIRWFERRNFYSFPEAANEK